MEEILTREGSNFRHFRLNQSNIEKLATNQDIYALPLERLWIGVDFAGGGVGYSGVIALAKKSTYLTIVYAAEVSRQPNINEYDAIADAVEQIISKNNVVHIPVEICVFSYSGIGFHPLEVTLREHGLRYILRETSGNREVIRDSTMLITKYLHDQNLWWCKSDELPTLEILTERLRDLRFMLYVFPFPLYL